MKKLVRKGIPNRLRGRVWMEVTGAAQLLASNAGIYQKLVEEADEAARPEALSQIELDLHRTFPDHPGFNAKVRGPEGSSPPRGSRQGGPLETPSVQSLRRVLRAYAARNGAVGYCQGMNFIAGVMLLFLDEESVFWLLSALLEDILPADYYAQDLIGCTVDLRVFSELLAAKYPKVWRKFTESGVTVEFFALEWFISIFSKTLPSETVLRIWDCIFFEGYKIVFRVAMGVVGLAEAQLVAAGDQTDLLEVVQLLGRHVLEADALLKASFAIQLKREEIQGMRLRLRAEVEKERRERSLRG